ncbi:quinone oxidoreductase [Lysinibacillus sp. CTST325]
MRNQEKMQVVRIYEYGGPEKMQLEWLDVPKVGKDEVLVKVKFASVNFLDIQMRRGDLVKQQFYGKEAGFNNSLPITIGSQCMGVIEAVGENVDHLKPGDRVICGGGGTYATYVVASAKRMVPINIDIPDQQAAAGLTQGFLAYAFTHKAYPIQGGEWCLVQAAAGGLGSLICQMTKLRGGKVIGVTSKEEKAKFVLEAGADIVLISTKENIPEKVREITNGEGVRVVYDGVGKDTFESNLNSLGLGGYLVMYGQSSGYVPPFDIMKLQEKGSLFLTRTNGLPYMKYWPEYMENFQKWVENDSISIKIDHVYPLKDVAKAHSRMEDRNSIGRILLKP